MRILVTAGPTREYFDTVRFISNTSSGKMGFAIAAEAAKRGHDVWLVSGPVEMPEPRGVKMVKVISAREMFEASCAAFERCDAAIMAAAVCDFRPKMQSAEKMEKKGHSLILELDLTEDICACLGRNKGRRVVVGFAMEDHDHHRSAERKLRQKRCDAIVLNPVSTAGGDSGEIEVFSPETGWQPPVHGTKAELAEVVVTLTEQLTRSGGAGDGQAPDG